MDTRPSSGRPKLPQEHAELVRSLLAGLLLALGLVAERLPLPAQLPWPRTPHDAGRWLDAARHGLAAAWHRADVDPLMALAAGAVVGR
jgi:hypothetical protein